MTTARPLRVRTITAFVALQSGDFDGAAGAPPGLAARIDRCAAILRAVETRLTGAGYEVQTVRIATNPFGEWLTARIDDGTAPLQKKPKTSGGGDRARDEVRRRLGALNDLLGAREIDFCSLGPSTSPEVTTDVCPLIVALPPGRFCCSTNVEAGDADAARAAAKCMRRISAMGEEEVPHPDSTGEASHVQGGLGNFRFCAASRIATAPFFPGARAPADTNDGCSFAIGLENGGFACALLEEAQSIGNIKNVFDAKMREELLPIQDICLKFANAAEYPVKYLGIDPSLNPSLDAGGSVAAAIEGLAEVRGAFGGTGTLAAAAAVTTALQSLPDVLTTGYAGLMLPVLEDRRLAELGMASVGSHGKLTIQQLLCVSSVCGVGIDTVPIPGDVSEESLASLILDVAALAGRWNKPLSCRVFPVPGGRAGEPTTFDSPYLSNSCIFDL